MTLQHDALIPLKRVEIVFDEEDMEELQNILKTIGARGYTYIKHAGGYGSRGERSPDTFGLREENVVIILACTVAQAEKLVTMLSPKMEELGGMCLISDCYWVKGAAESY